MIPSDFPSRIRRLYAAVEVMREFELTKFPAKIFPDKKRLIMCQDFSGGLTQAEMENYAGAILENIGAFEYHLQQWASHNGKSSNRVSKVFRDSYDICLIHDLWNSDKHPGQSRSSRSCKNPKLVEVGRQMQLQTQAKEGSCVAMTLGKYGTPVVSGDGSAVAIITGDIVDLVGSVIADFAETVDRALVEIEGLMSEFDISLT